MPDLPRKVSRGYTIVEVSLTVAVFSVLTVITVSMIRSYTRASSSMEAQNVLRSGAFQAMVDVRTDLAKSRRVMWKGDLLVGLLPKLTPAPDKDSRLAVRQALGLIDPVNVGNELFIAAEQRPIRTGSLQIDNYRFVFFYPAEAGSKTINGKPQLDLIKWQSVPYVDYLQIMQVPLAEREDVVDELMADAKYAWAWNAIEPDPTKAFFPLNQDWDNPPPKAVADHKLVPEPVPVRPIIQVLTGTTLGGFRVGLSQNVAAGKATHKVPALATVDNNFPAGFEVAATGTSSTPQIFVRIVLMAEGSFPGLITEEQVTTVTPNNLW